MPNTKQHSAVIRDAKAFDADSLRAKPLDAGVSLVVGKLRGGDGMEKVQGYQFAEGQFSATQARGWLKDRGVASYMFAPADAAAETFAEIRDMEIFEAGTYRGKVYTNKDLDKIIDNFRQSPVEPPLVVGHGEDQEFLKREGLPAAGWLTALKRVGSKLVASFGDVPRVIAEAIERKAYKQRSAEIYHDFQGRGMTLRRVALLGADVPEVKTLSDAVALYGDDDPDYETHEFAAADGDAIVTLPRSAQPTGDKPMPEATNEQPRTFTEDQMQTLINASVQKAVTEQTTKLSEQVTKLTTERDDLKKKSEQHSEAEAKHAAELHKIELERFIEKLKTAGTLPPAFEKMGLIKFMASLDHGEGDDVAVVEFGEKEEKVAQLAWFEKFLEQLPKVVTFEEVAPDASSPDDDDAGKGDLPKTMDDKPVDPESAKLVAKAEAYAEKHECDFETALIAVS